MSPTLSAKRRYPPWHLRVEGLGICPSYFCHRNITRSTEHCGLSRRNRRYREEEKENYSPTNQSQWNLFQKDFDFLGGATSFIFKLLDLILPVWSHHFHSVFELNLKFSHHQHNFHSLPRIMFLFPSTLPLSNLPCFSLDFKKMTWTQSTDCPIIDWAIYLIPKDFFFFFFLNNSGVLNNYQGKGRSYGSGGVITCSSPFTYATWHICEYPPDNKYIKEP